MVVSLALPLKFICDFTRLWRNFAPPRKFSAYATGRKINKPKLEDAQCGFILAVTLQTNFTLRQIFEKSWDYIKYFCTCFVDLEKAYARLPREKLWGVLQEYGVDGRLLLACRSLYSCSEVFVRVSGGKSQPFTVGFGLRKGCMLSSLLFIV